MSPHAAPPKLHGCYVISLRPVGGHAPLRRAAATLGARTLALSPWRIAPRDDAETRRALRDALRADTVVFTSPAAVRATSALQALRPRRGQAWLAVGAGIDDVQAPARMDSEGLLDLPALRDVRGRTIALVTAPGGRGVIAQALQARGATLQRADVYARVPVSPAAAAVARLRTLGSTPLLLALSSGEALLGVLAALPSDAATRLRGARVLAASERLATLARDHGFGDVVVAADARPRSLLAVAAPPVAPR
ncbi:MAG: uroporphyrinogen-III synthase [Proteobacteria bacterium]|nr:uroporphyrinogen-III synthase [Pseudomonadota bacterium]